MSYQTASCPILGSPEINLVYKLKGSVQIIGSLSLGQTSFSFKSSVSQSVTAGGVYVIPTGVWYVLCAANTKIQINVAGTWTDFTGVAGKSLVISDGANVRINNTGAAAESSTLIQIA